MPNLRLALALVLLAGCGSVGQQQTSSGSTTSIASGGAGGSGGTTSTGGAGGAPQSTSSSASASSTSSSSSTTTTSSSSTSSGATFSCTPDQQNTTDGGGRCADLNQAWTGRGINVGYYAYRVKQPLAQYSGDFSGNPSTIFQSGGATKGVILQVIPAGAYVGLSSNGPWYAPPTGCLSSAFPCGDPSHAACGDSSPPMRPTNSGFAWGYAYSGASHMQGWIPFDPAYLEFAGFDASHPCALGPAGADFEVHAACGQPTACSGSNPTCGAVNRCDEGKDDCGSATCGAMSGGALTPSAWHKTVAKPTGDHACTQKMPPQPSVTCLANGGDQDFFFVYPFGAYVYWAQNSTTKHWLHYGDQVQVYFHTRDAQDVLWDFVEVLSSGAPTLTPASDGAGAPASCTSSAPDQCTPCKNGGTCGWVQDVFLK